MHNKYKCEVQCDDRKQLMIACLVKQLLTNKVQKKFAHRIR